LVSVAYMAGSSELRKNEYVLTGDNKITKIQISKNGVSYLNWRYEYFTNMPGLKKSQLCKADTSDLYDVYSQEEYEYDLAGNIYRYRGKNSGTQNWNSVTSSKNNQTTQIGYAADSVYPIRGKASADASLAIMIDDVVQTYTRPVTGDAFTFGVPSYTTTKKFSDIKIESEKPSGNGAPFKTMTRGKAYLESSPESFVYDNNGNLISDGRWIYSWNNNDHLVAVETNAAAVIAGVPREKYAYTYDWIGNKTKCEYFIYSDNNWQLLSTNKRYYDDHNLIYETTEYIDGRSSEVKKYYFGTDLQGKVYGTAGTGGLRMMELNGKATYVFNNIIGSTDALYDADSEAVNEELAEYVYSAYGEMILQNGSLAESNPITYSTRYKESNTGLVGYTFRHYSPRLMKWLSKDPIAEQGGVNLYQMVASDPVNRLDILGRASKCTIEIYFGHGSPDGGGDVGDRLADEVTDALKKGIPPSSYKVDGISCHDRYTNMFNGNYDIGGASDRTPDLRPATSDLSAEKQIIEARIAQAKTTAKSSMCNKSPDCCKDVTIQVKVIIDYRYDQNNRLALNTLNLMSLSIQYAAPISGCN
jgi:RHS repeat-associated core domain